MTTSLLVLENHNMKAIVSPFGAQVISFIPKSDNRDRLFTSPLALFNTSSSIRGGIPICWPWFGTRTGLPTHGYAHKRLWQMTNLDEGKELTVLKFELFDTRATEFDFCAKLTLELKLDRSLEMKLTTTNTGVSSLDVGAAFHNYLAVTNIQKTNLEGLDGEYLDKNLNWALGETPIPYSFSAPTDRIHLSTATSLQLLDSGNETQIKAEGHDSYIVWNPWIGCEKQFTDLSADSYQYFLCVETGLTQGYKLLPGASVDLWQQIT
jgi:glucose-6-phosphate 1-epimerase